MNDCNHTYKEEEIQNAKKDFENNNKGKTLIEKVEILEYFGSDYSLKTILYHMYRSQLEDNIKQSILKQFEGIRSGVAVNILRTVVREIEEIQYNSKI